MSNYFCTTRSNYFRVKDVASFESWAKRRDVHVHTNPAHPERYALFSKDEDTGMFPNRDAETDEAIDFLAEISSHLAEGSVAIIMEAGAEKLRYIEGYASAINASGQRVELTLDSIYELAAAQLGGQNVTRAEF